jgi:hypothetical protein
MTRDFAAYDGSFDINAGRDALEWSFDLACASHLQSVEISDSAVITCSSEWYV